MSANDIPEIFNPRRRRAMLDRAANLRSTDAFLWQHMADALTEQLAVVSRQFERVLFIGPIGHWAKHILGNQTSEVQYAPLCPTDAAIMQCAVVCEDTLLYLPGSFDLIISAGTLDSVNDLPGALIQIRRMLVPDGLFLSVLFGAGSLAALRSVLMQADGDRAMPHIHPQIELRSAADLLSRTGFALPVADADTLHVRYRDWRTLVRDIRACGTGNALAGIRPFPGKEWIRNIDSAWAQARSEDGKVSEQFVFLNLSAWSPSPAQPKPAARGSGTVSLTNALITKLD